METVNSSLNKITQILQDHGLRPTYQRIKVLEYIKQKESHPTVAIIFEALNPQIPSLSKATIYNTLHTFIEAGLIRDIMIDEGETHYDYLLSPHGHFLCKSCGAISDFPINIDMLLFTDLDQYKIAEKDVFFRGLCPNCLNIVL